MAVVLVVEPWNDKTAITGYAIPIVRDVIAKFLNLPYYWYSQNLTRWLYCVECPQYSTRRRSASNKHRSSMLRKNR